VGWSKKGRREKGTGRNSSVFVEQKKSIRPTSSKGKKKGTFLTDYGGKEGEEKKRLDCRDPDQKERNSTTRYSCGKRGKKFRFYDAKSAGGEGNGGGGGEKEETA